MQVGMDVLQGDEIGKCAALGRFDFAGVFTEFRCDPGQADRNVNLFFSGAEEFRCIFDDGSAGIHRAEGVLVEAEIAIECELAHTDIMRLAAGEIT